MSALNLSEEILQQVYDHGVRDYPRECCGMVFTRRNDHRAPTRIRPCTNAQDPYHAMDPETFPRTAKTAYFIDPKELFEIEKELSRRQERIALIYHSHIDTGAYFSEEDVRQALSGGEPVYPNVEYLVMSVVGGKVASHKICQWRGGEGRFAEILSRSEPIP